VPATAEDEELFTNKYVPRLCNSYVYEKQGGQTEVYLTDSEGGHRFFADNLTPDGGLVENKAAIVSIGARNQLGNYLRYLDENGGSLDYNFFNSPSGTKVGPTYSFASALADAATKYDIGIHIYGEGWWDTLQ